MKPEKFTVAQVAEALRLSAGIHVVAASKLKCSRHTIARMVAKYAKLQRVQAELDAEILDLGEGVLVKALKSDDPRVSLDAAKFLLKTKGKIRGYVERQELAAAEKPPVDPKDMTDEELEAYTRSEGRVLPRPRQG
jgi:hypothetical protein